MPTSQEVFTLEAIKLAAATLSKKERRDQQVDRGVVRPGTLLSPLDLGDATLVTGTTRVQNGGTAQTSFAKGDLLAGTAVAGVTTKIAVPADGLALVANSAAAGGWSGAAPAPAAHHTTHESGGSDVIKLDDLSAPDDNTDLNVSSTKHGLSPKSPADATQFLNGAATPAYAGVKDSDLSTSDITTNNASTSKHGFMAKLVNDATKYFDGTGAQSVPAGTFIKRTPLAAGNGTHTPDSKCKSMWVRCQGPGGAGGGCTGAANQTGPAAGGAAGGYCELLVTGVSGTYAWLVGTGGTGGVAGNNPGNPGSAATTFVGTGANLSAGPGSGGGGIAAGTALAFSSPAGGGTSSGGDVNTSGQPGQPGIRLSGTVSISGEGGPSVFGGGANGRQTNGAGIASASIGAGGGGANSANNANSLSGGAGGDGAIIVYEFT